MKASPLAESLMQLLPQSLVVRQVSQDWHSATFSGCRCAIELVTSADDTTIAGFVAAIGDHEFDICGSLVADIGVTAQTADTDGGTRLTVEALLLDEEL